MSLGQYRYLSEAAEGAPPTFPYLQELIGKCRENFRARI